MSDTFVKLYKQVAEDKKSGKITPLMASAYHSILDEVDYHTGVWTGSAAKLKAAFGNQIGINQAQKVLNGLSNTGYIKTFYISGKKGNYPVLVDGYRINGNGIALDAKATTDPANRVYVKVGTESVVASIVAGESNHRISGGFIEPTTESVAASQKLPPERLSTLDSSVYKRVDGEQETQTPKSSGQSLVKVLKSEIRLAGCVLRSKYLDGYQVKGGSFTPGLKSTLESNNWSEEEVRLAIKNIVSVLDAYQLKQADEYVFNGLAEEVEDIRAQRRKFKQQAATMDQLTIAARKQAEYELSLMETNIEAVLG